MSKSGTCTVINDLQWDLWLVTSNFLCDLWLLTDLWLVTSNFLCDLWLLTDLWLVISSVICDCSLTCDLWLVISSVICDCSLTCDLWLVISSVICDCSLTCDLIVLTHFLWIFWRRMRAKIIYIYFVYIIALRQRLLQMWQNGIKGISQHH